MNYYYNFFFKSLKEALIQGGTKSFHDSFDPSRPSIYLYMSNIINDSN